MARTSLPLCDVPFRISVLAAVLVTSSFDCERQPPSTLIFDSGVQHGATPRDTIQNGRALNPDQPDRDLPTEGSGVERIVRALGGHSIKTHTPPYLPEAFSITARVGSDAFGSAPQEVEIHQDGRVVVRTPENATPSSPSSNTSNRASSANPTQVHQIARRILQALPAFLTRDFDDGSNCVTCGPWTTLSLHSEGRVRSLSFYSDCTDPGTRSLNALASRILSFATETPSLTVTEDEKRIETSIRRQDDTHFTFVDAFLNQAAHHPFLHLHIVDGGRDRPLAIYGIRRNSLWGRMGLQNGDRILRIDDITPLTEDDLHQSLRALPSRFKIRIRRRGQLVTLHYQRAHSFTHPHSTH